MAKGLLLCGWVQYTQPLTTIDIDDIQGRLAEYLVQPEEGQTLIIARKGRPVAEIKPLGSLPEVDPTPDTAGITLQPRPFGLARGEFVVPDDFDDPLPEVLQRLFDGEEE